MEITGGVLTIAEAAERLRLAPRTIYEMLERGDLIATTLPSGRRRVTVRSLERMLARGVKMPTDRDHED